MKIAMMQCSNVGSGFNEDSMCTMYGTICIIFYAVDDKYTVYTNIQMPRARRNYRASGIEQE